MKACTTVQLQTPSLHYVSQPDPGREREHSTGPEGEVRSSNEELKSGGEGKALTDDLATEQMNNRVDSIANDTLNKEGQHQTVSKL